jgi:hypothetical protein
MILVFGAANGEFFEVFFTAGVFALIATLMFIVLRWVVMGVKYLSSLFGNDN